MLGFQSMGLHLPDQACSARESTVHIENSIAKHLRAAYIAIDVPDYILPRGP